MSGIPHQNISTGKGVFVDTSCITPLPTSQLLNDYGIQHDPHCLKKIIRKSYDDSNYWHRFTIGNESYSCSDYKKNFILRAVTDFVYPSELLPVYVTEKATKLFFLARNCLEAIIKLCEAGLRVPNPHQPESPFKVVIIKDVLTVSQIPVVQVESNILEVLQKRKKNEILDLTEFHEDEGLHEFCPLSQPKLLLYVLNLSAQLEIGKKKISKVILSYNYIKGLPNLDSLKNRSFNFIDLSFNRIQNIDDINELKHLPNIISVRLEGNPLLCCFDSNSATYVLYMKTICKNLRILDGKKLIENGFYKRKKTFLCDTRGFDFANQFVEQYFTYYDERNRPNIGSYYNEDCLFSLTYREIPIGQPYMQTSIYKYISRNLLENNGQNQINQNLLFCGKLQVLEQILSLPETEHNPCTFSADLVAYSKNQAIIYVSGVFKELSLSQCTEQSFYGFTRNFVLSSTDGKVWFIQNDQMHLYNLFFPIKTRWQNSSTSTFPDTNSNSLKMNTLVLTFGSITGLTDEYSRSFLEKTKWNLELALNVFIDEHINNEIPDDAFKKEREEEIIDVSDDENVVVTEGVLPPIETLLIDKPKPTSIWSNDNRNDSSSSNNQEDRQDLLKNLTSYQNISTPGTFYTGEKSFRPRNQKNVINPGTL